MSDKQLKSKMSSVPIWKKMNLTVEEASEYSGIGASKIKELSNSEDCPFVLWNGVILSILVDTFISKISLPMQPVPEIGSISGA